MKKSSSLFSLLIVLAASLITSEANAGLILNYDSLTTSQTALTRVDSQTDNVLVASSDQFNTFGSKGFVAAVHTSQANVQGAFGNQNDLLFRFGNSSTVVGNGILPGTLSAGHAASGPRIDFSYTAAADQNLDEFSFHLWNNSQDASSYGARDVGLFVDVGGTGTFTQFGNLDTSATANGDQGVVVFTDNVFVASGDLVEFRLAFTDRTRTNNDLQAATRIGDVQIFATAVAVVPEPSSACVLGALGLGFFVRRRR